MLERQLFITNICIRKKAKLVLKFTLKIGRQKLNELITKLCLNQFELILSVEHDFKVPTCIRKRLFL